MLDYTMDKFKRRARKNFNTSNPKVYTDTTPKGVIEKNQMERLIRNKINKVIFNGVGKGLPEEEIAQMVRAMPRAEDFEKYIYEWIKLTMERKEKTLSLIEFSIEKGMTKQQIIKTLNNRNQTKVFYAYFESWIDEQINEINRSRGIIEER